MTTSHVQLTTDGTGKYVATATFSEDAVTKHVQRFVQCNTAGTEYGTPATPVQVIQTNTAGNVSVINSAGWVIAVSNTSSLYSLTNSAGWIVSVSNTGGIYSLANTAGWLVGVGSTSIVNSAGWIVNVANTGGLYSLVNTAGWTVGVGSTSIVNTAGWVVNIANTAGHVVSVANTGGITSTTASILGNVPVYKVTNPGIWSVNSGVAATATTAPWVTAPGASSSLYLTDVVISCLAAGSVALYESVTKPLVGLMFFAANGGMVANYVVPIKLTANSNLTVTCSVVGNIELHGYTAL